MNIILQSTPCCFLEEIMTVYITMIFIEYEIHMQYLVYVDTNVSSANNWVRFLIIPFYYICFCKYSKLYSPSHPVPTKNRYLPDFLPARIRRIQAGTESELCVCMYILWCQPLSPHPPPVLSVQRRDHLRHVQEQSLGTSHSMGLDNCSSTVTQCAVLFSLQRDVPQGIPPYTGTR